MLWENMLIRFILLAYFSTEYVGHCTDTTTLRFVSVLFRHGDRTPIHMFSGDPNTEETWPQQLGQLTEIGMRQEHELGIWLRERYNGFISNIYNMSEIYVRSTNIDRALMSAYMVTEGMYPSTEEQKSISGMAYQPVPVHNLPETSDYLLTNKHADCDMYREAVMLTQTNEEYINFTEKYKPFFQELSNDANLTLTLADGGGLSDTSYIEKLYNRTWPSWMTESRFATLHYQIHPKLLYYHVAIGNISRYTGGVHLQQIVRDMEFSIHNSSSIKMKLYSAHDTNVLNLLSALHLFNNRTVPYHGTVIIELHSKQIDEHYVKVFYQNDTSLINDPVLLTVPGCESPECPFETFLKVTRDMRIEPGDDVCGGASWPSIKQLVIVIVVTVSVGMAILIVLFGIYGVCHRRCRRKRVTVKHYGKLRLDVRPEEVPMMLHGDGSDAEE